MYVLYVWSNKSWIIHLFTAIHILYILCLFAWMHLADALIQSDSSKLSWEMI